MAALLHDVIEDTGVLKHTIGKEFGEDVAHLVDGVSKLSNIFQSRAEAQAENFQKMTLAMAKDIRVIMIKLADRLHNMRTLDHLNSEKQRRIAKEKRKKKSKPGQKKKEAKKRRPPRQLEKKRHPNQI